MAAWRGIQKGQENRQAKAARGARDTAVHKGPKGQRNVILTRNIVSLRQAWMVMAAKPGSFSPWINSSATPSFPSCPVTSLCVSMLSSIQIHSTGRNICRNETGCLRGETPRRYTV